MLLERPPMHADRKRHREYAIAVEALADPYSWVPSRDVFVEFHGREPSGYPDPMPRFVRALKEAARADFIDGRWDPKRRGFVWRPRL